MTHRLLNAVPVVAGILLFSGAASGQDKIYPPGTDCANLPTIAERLLCGRQEFHRHQSNTSIQSQTPSPEGDSVPESQRSLPETMDEDAPVAIPDPAEEPTGRSSD